MSWAHVQGITGGHGGSGATITLTFGSNIGSGNAVCGGGQFTSGVSISSIQDNQGNNYNVESVITSGAQTAFAFSLGNITNGPHIITITLSGSSGFNTAVADEYSNSGGATANDPRDVHGGRAQATPGTGSNAYTSGNFTTTANGDLLYGMIICSNSAAVLANMVAGTGFTLRSNDTPGTGAALSEDSTQSNAGTAAATFTDTTDTGTVNSVTYLIALKAPSGVVSFTTIGISSSEW